MFGSTPVDPEDLLEKLSRSVAEWEDSPYYRAEEELFDIERFLLDHHADEFRTELERTYGRPLNEKFWNSSLAYQRLKRAREKIKALDNDQERRRHEYAQSVEENKKAWQQWLNEMSSSNRRAQFKVIPGGKKDMD